MRIAISGTHFSGKSTLIAALLEQFPNYTSVDEPYFLLEEDGYEFSNPPSLEDFEQQLKRSVAVIEESRNNTIFDRSPLDYLAYALAIAESPSLGESIDTEEWIQMMQEAIRLLDFIIFVPIENRIPVPASEDLKLRMKVDEKLQEILLEDSLGILDEIEVLEVTGSLEKRAKMVKSKLFQIK
ncbi:MAG: AAA family ATPase [Simkania sp.]|nr:AAA family ATPase [Simkania sp.]